MRKIYRLARDLKDSAVYCEIYNSWNFEKEICPASLQPLDRSRAWFKSNSVDVRFSRLLQVEKQDIVFSAYTPFVFVSEKARSIFRSIGLPLSFVSAQKLSLSESDQNYYHIDSEESVYLMRCSNRHSLDFDRTEIAWQKDCPGCGKTYPLFHTMKNPVVVAPKGSDTRIFTLEPWPDSYIYISQDTLKEWKKLGLTGIENIKKPFGMLDIQ